MILHAARFGMFSFVKYYGYKFPAEGKCDTWRQIWVLEGLKFSYTKCRLATKSKSLRENNTLLTLGFIWNHKKKISINMGFPYVWGHYITIPLCVCVSIHTSEHMMTVHKLQGLSLHSYNISVIIALPLTSHWVLCLSELSYKVVAPPMFQIQLSQFHHSALLQTIPVTPGIKWTEIREKKLSYRQNKYTVSNSLWNR